MDRIVKLLCLLSLGGVLAHPTSAAAQGIQLADLVGTWEAVPGMDSTLLVDTTGIKHTLHIKSKGGKAVWRDDCTTAEGKPTRCAMGGMSLEIARVSGDTLVVYTKPDLFYKITLENQRLSVASFGRAPFQVYQRVDAPKNP